MQLSVTGRHIEITESMKAYAEEKASKLVRFYDRIETIDVILDREAQLYRVEMVARADHKHTFVSHETAPDFHEAVDLASDKLGRQLTKHKEQFRNRKHVVKPDEGPGAMG